MVSSSNTAADPLLSSFILPVADDFAKVESKLSTETSISKESLDEVIPERYDAFLYSILASTCNVEHNLLYFRLKRDMKSLDENVPAWYDAFLYSITRFLF